MLVIVNRVAYLRMIQTFERAFQTCCQQSCEMMAIQARKFPGDEFSGLAGIGVDLEFFSTWLEKELSVHLKNAYRATYGR